MEIITSSIELACATCLIDPSHQVAQAANGAILLMLFVPFPLLGGFLAFIRYLRKCEKRALALEEGN